MARRRNRPPTPRSLSRETREQFTEDEVEVEPTKAKATKAPAKKTADK